MTRFSRTESLEVCYSLLNKWVPKSTHFLYEGMIVRSQLAAADFNLGSDLEQKTTKMGKECFDAAFSKITNHWSAKPIKVAKNREKFHNMVKWDCILNKQYCQSYLKIQHQNQN